MKFLAIVCFDNRSARKCESFDEISVTKIFETKDCHSYGELGLYKNQVIAIGGVAAAGVVEALTVNGWTILHSSSHPM